MAKVLLDRSLLFLSADRGCLEKVVKWCVKNRKYTRHAVLYVITYAFLLRLPSEALPLTAGGECSQSRLSVDADSVTIVLQRRRVSILVLGRARLSDPSNALQGKTSLMVAD